MKYKPLFLIVLSSVFSLNIPLTSVLASEKTIETTGVKSEHAKEKVYLKYRGFKILGPNMNRFCEYQDKFGHRVLIPQRNFKNNCPKSIPADQVKK